jgi:uncharacterized protein (TIGR02246 family)
MGKAMNADIEHGQVGLVRTLGSRSALALMVIGTSVASCFAPYARAASNDESAIRDVMKRWDDAINTNDLPRFLSSYVQDASVVHFEENTEKPVVGFESFRQYAESDLKPEFQDHARTTIETVLVDQSVAVAVCVVNYRYVDATRSTEPHSEVERLTMVFKKVDGNWLIWHEHFSLPYDYDTGKVVFESAP